LLSYFCDEGKESLPLKFKINTVVIEESETVKKMKIRGYVGVL
jgi:hypothetical protein